MGLMLNTLRTAIYVNPWVAALPGAMIFAVSICFNLLSDGLRSAMDIRNWTMSETNTSVAMLEPIEDVGGVAQPLLQVNGLTKHFPVRGGLFAAKRTVRAVDNVSFSVAKGETVGIVGESHGRWRCRHAW